MCRPMVIRGNEAATSYNLTEIFQLRMQGTPKEDWDRLNKCWGYIDCGDCHRSEGHCGWCPLSSTCLPLPLDPLSRMFPLLSPMRVKGICAFGSERFELRTGGLGCQVSTITFLTSIITIFCTLFGVFVMYGLLRLYTWVRLGTTRGGYVVYGDGTEGIWVRKNKSWGEWWKRVSGKAKASDTDIIEDSRPFRRDERQPLLNGQENN